MELATASSSYYGGYSTDFPLTGMFLSEFLSKLFVTLAERLVAYHVGEHDGREFALLVSAHFK